MGLTPVEIIVVIFAVIGLIKMLSFLVSKTWWMDNVSSKVLGNGKVTGLIFVVLATVVFYYLQLEMSITQIMGGVVFGALLYGLVFLAYSKDLMNLANKIVKGGFNGWMKLYMLIWVILLVWVLYVIFI